MLAEAHRVSLGQACRDVLLALRAQGGDGVELLLGRVKYSLKSTGLHEKKFVNKVISQSVVLSVYLPVCMFICLFVRLFVCPFVCLSFCLYICLPGGGCSKLD